MQVGRYCRGSEYLDVLVKLPFIIILAVRMSTGNTEISAGIIAGNYFIRFTYSVLISQCQISIQSGRSLSTYIYNK